MFMTVELSGYQLLGPNFFRIGVVHYNCGDTASQSQIEI